MTNTHFSVIIFILFLLLAALALTLVAVLTDYWYIVETDSSVNKTTQQKWNYNYGLWRKCYDDIPEDIGKDQHRNCVAVYDELIKLNEDALPYEDKLYLHLSRSVVGFAIAMGGVQLFAILTLLCGLWPGSCSAVRRAKLYWATSLILLLATMCGIVSGICFIALRDIDKADKNTYPDGIYTQYGWSFMVSWIATGLSIVDSFIILCLLRTTYEDVNETQKYYYYHMRD